MARRTRGKHTDLEMTVSAAKEAGLTYGLYVARMEHPVIVHHKVKPISKPSKWTSRNRTLYEGLEQELMHIDTRAEWLNDPFAKEAIAAKEREAERKVRNFIERTEAALKGSHHVLSEERRWIIDMYRKGHSQKSIAAMLGRSKCTVSKIINEWRKEQWTTE